MYGGKFYAVKDGPGSAVNMFGIHSQVGCDSGTCTNAYSAYLGLTNSGTITNAYGMYIDDIGGTNQWGVYQAGNNDLNYFAGNVGIGTAAPSAKLDVLSNSTSTSSQSAFATKIATNPSAAGGNYEASYFEAQSSGTNSLNNLAGVNIWTHSANSGGTAHAYGVYSYVSNSATAPPTKMSAQSGQIDVYGSVPTSIGGEFSISTNGGGTKTKVNGLSSTVSLYSGATTTANMLEGLLENDVSTNVAYGANLAIVSSATLTNAYGVSVNMTGSGIATAYGVRIADLAATTSWGIYQEGTNDRNYFAGNVGVGATSPSEKLHVVGNLRVQGSTDCTLGNGAGGTNCSSDMRLKENVQEIDHSLEKILSLRGVEFDWNQKSQSPGDHAIGVIAQDVEKVFPTAVIDDPSSGYKKVDYAVLVAPIIQAFKELNKHMKELFSASEGHSRRLASIEADNAAKDQEIANLKADAEKQRLETEKQKQENAAIKAYLCAKDPKSSICR